MANEHPVSDPVAKGSAHSRPRLEQIASNGPSTVDQMSEHSFPASDPPAVWTWEVCSPPDPRRRTSA
jgi:hypothetical protein